MKTLDTGKFTLSVECNRVYFEHNKHGEDYCGVFTFTVINGDVLTNYVSGDDVPESVVQWMKQKGNI
jgi:hypothetical protein